MNNNTSNNPNNYPLNKKNKCSCEDKFGPKPFVSPNNNQAKKAK